MDVRGVLCLKLFYDYHRRKFQLIKISQQSLLVLSRTTIIRQLQCFVHLFDEWLLRFPSFTARVS